MSKQLSLRETYDGLAARRLSAEEITAQALAAIDDPKRQGSVAFLEVAKAEAMDQARYWDQMRSDGSRCPGLAGVPVSIKDCIDVKGSVTCAGSRVLEGEPPAETDAGIVAALRRHGAIIIGRTNMTEFAYSGLGNNAHFGTPFSDVGSDQIAGGSSSGAAVSVAEGMATIAIGTDTSGSARIPAAFCGVAGFRPSQGRYPIDGVIPLAPSFDVVGTLALTADCLSYLDAVLSAESPNPRRDNFKNIRFLVPEEGMESLDHEVSEVFNVYLGALANKGIKLERRSVSTLTDLRRCASDAGIVAAEALAWHKDLFAQKRQFYDPRVAVRLAGAHKIAAAVYLRGIAEIRRLRREIDETLDGFSGMLMPTVPIVAPRLAEISEDEQYLKVNAMVIRNTAIANHLDLPSITFPINEQYKPKVGAMLIGARSRDREILRLGATLESFSIGADNDRS